MTVLDVWHCDDGVDCVSIVYDGMYDSAVMLFITPGRTISTAMQLSDILSLRDFAKDLGDRLWTMESGGESWMMAVSEGDLIITCADGPDVLGACFPMGCVHDLFLALDRRWGEDRCRT